MARGMGPSRPGACGSWGTDARLCDKEGLTLVTCLPQVCVMGVVQEARLSRGQTALKNVSCPHRFPRSSTDKGQSRKDKQGLGHREGRDRILPAGDLPALERGMGRGA